VQPAGCVIKNYELKIKNWDWDNMPGRNRKGKSGGWIRKKLLGIYSIPPIFAPLKHD
jgi:hypothetical protein